MSTLPTQRLPGEMEVDDCLLDGVVLSINQVHATKGLETALSFAALLLGAFFDGDLEQYRQRHRGHMSFRAMAERADLSVSWSTLYYSLAVLDQLDQIPAQAAPALSFSHHRLLLPVKDPELKAELALRAWQEQLTVRELAASVQEARLMDAPVRRPGRKRLPAVVKGVRRLRKAVELATSEELSEEALAQLSEDQRQQLVHDLEHQMRVLQELQAKVSEVLS